MKQYLVLDVPVEVTEATRLLNQYAKDNWRVVGTFYYGGSDNAVILSRQATAWNGG